MKKLMKQTDSTESIKKSPLWELTVELMFGKSYKFLKLHSLVAVESLKAHLEWEEDWQEEVLILGLILQDNQLDHIHLDSEKY